MKMVKLKIITIMLIISLGCVSIHYKAKKDLDEFRYRMFIHEQHMDSTYISINNHLDNIQHILDSYK